ncbi:MAG: enoyl-CoA hydratase/isomerase family protein [Planctomycetota bacterium]|nr:MAG: enoyl-CoA hydratase/isomerase family protein [Planctomycetota bacterium]
MTHPHIKTRLEEAIWIVTIDRPAKRNALTPEMIEALSAAVREADDQPEVRAVIVNAEGPVFSAGIDLGALAESMMAAGMRNPARWLRRLADRLQDALHTIEATEVPVIGAMQGNVMGLGLELALAFDLRVATEDCQLSIPEARVGLVADVGGTTRLARTVGSSRAKDMLLTARSVGAEEAHRWGLVNRVVPAGSEMTAAMTLAREIGANAPLAVGLAKLIVDQGDGVPKHTQMAIERWAQSQLITTADVAEAMQAFVEKRPPKFKGT